MSKSPNLESLAGQLWPLIAKHSDLLDSLDFVAGALVCIQQTATLQARPATLPTDYQKNLVNRVMGISRGKRPQNRYWLAGLQFNSALLRIAAAYHRVLKVLTGKNKGHVGDLLPLLPKFKNEKLKAVHQEVNRLKHDGDGLASGRKVTRDDALSALQELIDLIKRERP